jgi:neutral ceramidase
MVAIPALGRMIDPAPLRACLAAVPTEPKHHPPLSAIRAARAATTDPARRTELALEEYIVQGQFGSFDFPSPSPALPVQAFRLGAGLTLVGLPGEPFTATAQQIRAASTGTVLVTGYANQAAGYLPTKDEFGRSGLEVGCGTHAPGTAERLTSAAIDLIGALQV